MDRKGDSREVKVLICGDRKWGAVEREGDLITRPNNGFNYPKLLYRAMKKLGPEDSVVEGEAAGADIMSRYICELRDIPVTPIPADWCSFEKPCNKNHTHHGMKAGMLRNKEMAERGPDEVWAFHDDLTKSKGTMSMIRVAWSAGIPVKWFSPKFPVGISITPGMDLSNPLGGGSDFDPDEIPF